MIFRATGLLTLALMSAMAQDARPRMPLISNSDSEGAAETPGQISSKNTERLTLEEALSLAQKYSPGLQAATAQTEGARAGIETAKEYPNPTFNVLAGHQHSRPILTPAVPGLLQHYGVSQPIDLPGVRHTRINAAAFGAESSRFGLAGVRRAVRAGVKHAFFEVLRRKEEIGHAQENLKLVQDLRRRTQVEVKVGEAARLELTRAEAEIAIAQTAVKNAQLQYIGAVSALRAAVAAPLDANIDPEGTLYPTLTLPPLETLRAEVLANHPAIAQAKAEIDRARAQVANEKALRMPQPSIDAEYEEQPDLGFYRVGVSIPLPIWSRRKGQIAEAAANLTRANALANQRRLEITRALEQAYGQYEVANQQVDSFKSGALRQAESALQAAQAAYKFGERGIIEVLDAQRVLHSVRGDLLDAQYERQAALIDLEELGAVDLGGKKK